MSKFIFILATAILAWGVARNVTVDNAIAGTGTMAMNTFYILAIALYAAAAAAELIWSTRGNSGKPEKQTGQA